MKVVELTLENGDKWQIPLYFIANNRADYYKGRAEEKGEIDEFNYKEEIDFIMNDDYEGTDWLVNNMNLEDFKDVLVIIKNPFEEEPDWVNAESNIIEVKDKK